MDREKLKIFISAYACEPNQGSEIGVGWNWVLEMSRYFELWVLTRKSNQHTIEPWVTEHPEFSYIHFLYYDWPKWSRFWKKGLRGVRTYYNLWQFCINPIVKRTMIKNDIRIFHHLTYGNVLWKVSHYGQRQFFIWGPAGGIETIPKEYSNFYPLKMQWVEWLRRIMARNLKFNTGFQRRCRHANLILCKTEILRNQVPEQDKYKAILFTDVAVNFPSNIPKVMEATSNKVVEYITVGRLQPWRGFDLTIEAFTQALKQKQNIHLTIIGDGPDKKRLDNLIKTLGITGQVTMTGAISMKRYRTYLLNCDVVVNAALKEGAVTVSFDSMAMGKPLICMDTTGYTRYFSNEYAEIIEIQDRETTIKELTNNILRLTNANLRFEMGKKAQQAGNHFTWHHHGEEVFETITKAIAGQ
jgi:glycosyltransferase involved in cell wall biosynthesis